MDELRVGPMVYAIFARDAEGKITGLCPALSEEAHFQTYGESVDDTERRLTKVRASCRASQDCG